jgi:sarcosine oxidase subunit gamma
MLDHEGTPLSVEIEEVTPEARFSLRLREKGREAAARALELDLPGRVGDVARGHGRAVVCLGPDEWLVTASEADRDAISEAFAAIYDAIPHSLVDVSDREVAIRLTGPGAFTLMTIGCPRDLNRLAPGRAVRTVFDGTTVILWRDAADAFRLDVWRSFAPHLRGLLETGRAEL